MFLKHPGGVSWSSVRIFTNFSVEASPNFRKKFPELSGEVPRTSVWCSLNFREKFPEIEIDVLRTSRWSSPNFLAKFLEVPSESLRTSGSSSGEFLRISGESFLNFRGQFYKFLRKVSRTCEGNSLNFREKWSEVSDHGLRTSYTKILQHSWENTSNYLKKYSNSPGQILRTSGRNSPNFRGKFLWTFGRNSANFRKKVFKFPVEVHRTSGKVFPSN